MLVTNYWSFAQNLERYYFERQRECKKLSYFWPPHFKKLSIKLTNKGLYLIAVEANAVKPTAQDYFEKLFETTKFNWKKYIF